MRTVIIVVTCDVCDNEIKEDAEGTSAIRFTVRGEQREMDICNECLGGSFLQEARPVKTRGKAKKSPDGSKFFCGIDGCEMSKDTSRGLKLHQSLVHKEAQGEA